MTCELCYAVDADVKVSLAWYVEGREPVQAIARCRDEWPCRQRVEARGDPWPLLERGVTA